MPHLHAWGCKPHPAFVKPRHKENSPATAESVKLPGILYPFGVAYGAQVDMRDLLMNVTTNDTANPLAERGALLGLSETFRRRINILYAFIRCGADSHAPDQPGLSRSHL